MPSGLHLSNVTRLDTTLSSPFLQLSQYGKIIYRECRRDYMAIGVRIPSGPLVMTLGRASRPRLSREIFTLESINHDCVLRDECGCNYKVLETRGRGFESHRLHYESARGRSSAWKSALNVSSVFVFTLNRWLSKFEFSLTPSNSGECGRNYMDLSVVGSSPTGCLVYPRSP